MNADWLNEPAKAGVFQLVADARAIAEAAEGAGLAVSRIDIGHAHDKEDFLGHVARAMNFPERLGADWDTFALGLKDLSWADAKGWVVILEKSKHFCGGHHHEFDEAMNVMAEAAASWRGRGKPFWTLIGGPEGWSSGYPPLPANGPLLSPA